MEELHLDAVKIPRFVQENLFYAIVSSSLRVLFLSDFVVVATHFKQTFIRYLPDLDLLRELTLRNLSTSPMTNYELLTALAGYNSDYTCELNVLSLAGM